MNKFWERPFMKTVWLTLRRYLKQSDLLLLFLALAAAFFGVVLIFSALLRQGQAAVQNKIAIQLLAIFLGMIGFFITSMLDIERFSQFWPIIFVLNLLFQASLFVFGVGEESTGNNSWLRFGPIGVQPAEVGKIIFIFTFAQHIFIRREHLNAFPTVMELLAHSLITIGMVYISSSDVGMAFTYLIITLVMLACSGMSPWWVGGIALGGAASTPLLWMYVLKDYHKLRIQVLFDPGISPKYAYHAKQSIAALRNGGVLGQGLTHGAQTQSGLLPTSHTDFIFSVCGEELGYIGCAAIILLLTFIVIRIYYNGSKANNRFGFLMCVGIGSMIMVQTLINVGMCVGIMPVIGLTLPFFSYGGTSVITMLTALGFTSGFASRQKPSWLRFGEEE